MTFEQMQARRRVEARVAEALRRERRADTGERGAGTTPEEAIHAALRAARLAGRAVKNLQQYRALKAELGGAA